MTSPGDDNGSIKLLLIDDDRKFCRLISSYLTPLGFEVTAVHHGLEGAEALVAPEAPWQIALLDVMLPGADGFEVLRRSRATCKIPILMLTARGEETDRIVGLEIGADDYVPKTFSTRELLARIRAALRRHQRMDTEAAPPLRELVAGPLRLNLDARLAVMDDEALSLTPLEFDLLCSLVKARGRVKTREALLNECRERNFDVFDRSIDVHISSLRKKIGDDARNPFYIRTVRAAGYLFTNEDKPEIPK